MCQSEGFRKFLTIALGTFVGVYCALSLFAAIHKPPVMMPPCAGFNPPPAPQMQCPFKQRHHFHKGQFPGNFKFNPADKFQKGHPAPFDTDKAGD